jgi:hypothetical protein
MVRLNFAQGHRSDLGATLQALEGQSVHRPRALREARKALDVHRGTGRLWAVLIQLEHSNGVERQLAVRRPVRLH